MATFYKTGDVVVALQAGEIDYLVHQVNCMGQMNSGIAKQIRETFPNVYKKYVEFCDNEDYTLGKILIVDDIINLFGQNAFGYDGHRYTNYEAFINGLEHIYNTIPTCARIGFPWRIGCDRGGADWEIIRFVIEHILGSKYDIYFYVLNGEFN